MADENQQGINPLDSPMYRQMLMNCFLNAYSMGVIVLDPNDASEQRFMTSSHAVVRNSILSATGLFLATGFTYRRWIRNSWPWYGRIPFIVIGGMVSFSMGFSIGRQWRDDMAAMSTAIKYEKQLIDQNPSLKLYHDPMHQLKLLQFTGNSR